MSSDDRDAIIKAFSTPTIQSFVRSSYEQNRKDLEASEKTRSEAKRLARKASPGSSQYEDIWIKYTTSVALAPNKTQALTYAYAERSVQLVRMGKFEDSIVDVQRAIDTSDCSFYRAKFLCMKASHLAVAGLSSAKALKQAEFCINGITDEDERNEILGLIGKIRREAIRDDDGNGNNDNYEEEEEQSIQRSSSRKTSTLNARANDFGNVTAKYDSVNGRYLVAKRDIEPGEVIFVELPYVSAPNLAKLHPICSHCFDICWSPVACDSCSLSLYCSERCKLEAWDRYHDLECVVLARCPWSRFYDVFALGVRLLIAGLREAGSIAKLKTLVEAAERDADDNPMKNFARNDIIGMNGFKSIYNLCCNVNTSSVNVVETFPVMATQILLTLAKSTTFFGRKFSDNECFDIVKSQDAMFVGRLILKLIKISHICKTRDINPGIDTLSTCDYVKEIQSHRSICLAPVFSLINHSCDPNVSACFAEGNKIVVYALCPIKKNEQILKSYIHNYYSAVDYNRQAFLEENYNFICQCDACEKNWPTLPFPSKSMKKGFDEFFDSLCDRPFEQGLDKKFIALVINVLKRNDVGVKYDEKMLAELAQFISEASEKLPRCSIVYRFLVLTLNFVFSQVHGHRLKFSDDRVRFISPVTFVLPKSTSEKV